MKTVGELKKLLQNIPDDYTIEIRVNREIPDEILKNMVYRYPYDTECVNNLEYDDIGVSDKEVCFSIEIKDL